MSETPNPSDAPDEAPDLPGPGGQDGDGSTETSEAATADAPEPEVPGGALIRVPQEVVDIAEETGTAPEQVISVLTATMSMWQGPLPPPSALVAYNDAYPRAAQDIVENWRGQTTHRQEIERQTITADIALRQRGQYCGLVIAMTVIIGGLILAGMGAELTGFVAILAGLGSVVGLFVYSRHRQDNELERKRQALEDDYEIDSDD